MNRARPLIVIAVLCAALAGACGHDEPGPISYSGNVVTISNQTKREWRQVEIWLNYHYRVTKPSMAAGERFLVPMDTFVAGYGQRFDVKKAAIQTIQVKATSFAGEAVDVMIGTGPRR